MRSTCSAWGLIIVLWLRESSWGWGDSFLFLVSSGPGAAAGRKILLLFSRNSREGNTFRDEGELVKGCAGSCTELADTMVPELVIPSRCAARVSFEAVTDDLEEDMLYAETYNANMGVLTLPARDRELSSESSSNCPVVS